jgi:hypothetical protein
LLEDLFEGGGRVVRTVLRRSAAIALGRSVFVEALREFWTDAELIVVSVESGTRSPSGLRSTTSAIM